MIGLLLVLGSFGAWPRAGGGAPGVPAAVIDQPPDDPGDGALDDEGNEHLDEDDLAVLGFRGLLVGELAPDLLEDLLGQLTGGQADADGEGREDGVHDELLAPRGQPADGHAEDHGHAQRHRGGVLPHLGDDLLAALAGAVRGRALGLAGELLALGLDVLLDLLDPLAGPRLDVGLGGQGLDGVAELGLRLPDVLADLVGRTRLLGALGRGVGRGRLGLFAIGAHAPLLPRWAACLVVSTSSRTVSIVASGAGGIALWSLLRPCSARMPAIAPSTTVTIRAASHVSMPRLSAAIAVAISAPRA